MNAPTGLAFDSAGNLYAANFIGSTIEKFTPGGVGSLFASTGGGVPQGLAFDNANNLYVANEVGNTIEQFTPGGVGSNFASIGLNQPSGLAFDNAGNLYAVNNKNNTIEKFTPGGIGSEFANTGLLSPTYIALVPEPSTWAFATLGILLFTRFYHCLRLGRDGMPSCQRRPKAAGAAIASKF